MIIDIYEDNMNKNDVHSCHFHSARAIIFDQGKVLLLYSKKLDYYMFPGGRIESDESPETCVKREVLEETGYHVSIQQKTILINEYYRDSSWHSHFFLCQRNDQAVQERSLTDEEHFLDIKLVWMPVEEALMVLDQHESTFSKASNIMQREFLALSNSL